MAAHQHFPAAFRAQAGALILSLVLGDGHSGVSQVLGLLLEALRARLYSGAGAETEQSGVDVSRRSVGKNPKPERRIRRSVPRVPAAQPKKKDTPFLPTIRNKTDSQKARHFIR
eukprot:TRINITY_DN13775_c0_g1_i3.p2 TRINITY_DN13775_c0_g1~~TRINITY_DN13775_c0_g1_i3.p2  ORF type:complete len:114 (-),score=17.63 TRINITY_DN13775_c0_g1_i3:136-477(-)